MRFTAAHLPFIENYVILHALMSEVIYMKSVTNPPQTRNYGIDLLRLFAMFYVVLSHVLGHGNAPNDMDRSSSAFIACHVLYILSISAVNIFALISGYVGYRPEEQTYRYSNILTIWLQVVFYNILIALLGELYNSELVTFRRFLELPFPIIHNYYWYFTSYTALFFLIPLLNAGLRNCSSRTLNILFPAILILFSILETGTPLFHLKKGYSFSWLMLLYILGAIMNKNRFSDKVTLFGLISAIVVLTISYAALTYCRPTLELMNLVYDTDSLFSYTAPGPVLLAILHVLLFAKLTIHGKAVKWIRFAAPGAFAVYILNTHFLIWDYIMNDTFRFLAEKPFMTVLAVILGFSAGFVVASVLIDHVR